MPGERRDGQQSRRKKDFGSDVYYKQRKLGFQQEKKMWLVVNPKLASLGAFKLKIIFRGPGKPCGSQRRQNLIKSCFIFSH